MRTCSKANNCDKPLTECRRIFRYNEVTKECYKPIIDRITSPPVKISSFYKDSPKRTYIEKEELKRLL